MKIKNIALGIICSLILLNLSVTAQKKLKTYDAEKFAKKVMRSLTPDLITKYMVDEKANAYFLKKGGYPTEKFYRETKNNFDDIMEDVKWISNQHVDFKLKDINVEMREEKPFVVANIYLNCSTKQGDFRIKLKYCVQSDISWYLGDGVIIEGEGFQKAIDAR